MFYFNTELTYAEMIRYFGLPGAAIMMALLFFPIAHAFLWNVNTRERALSLGLLAYLVMGATNPYFLIIRIHHSVGSSRQHHPG